MLLLCSCAATKQARKDNEELRAQLIEMQKSVANLNLRMEELSNSVFILQESSKASKDALKELRAQTTQPVVVVSETDPYARGGEAGKPMVSPGVGLSATGPSVNPEPPVLTNFPAGVDSKLASALDQFKKGNYGLAVYDLSAYLAADPGSKDAQTARFYLAESYFKLKEFGQALQEYTKLLQLNPKGKYAPTVLFRCGLISQALGDSSKARYYFTEVTKQFPSSKEARLAGEELAKQ